MATPLSTFANVDMGGDILCVKAIRTGFNNPGVSSGTGTTVLASMPQQSVNVGAALTLTADAHFGVSIFLNAATGTVTLPTATGSGNQYVITSTITAVSQIVTAPAGTLFGVCIIAATASGTFPINANATITMNGTTTGGIKGSQIICTDVASGVWVVEANLVGSSTATTPVT